MSAFQDLKQGSCSLSLFDAFPLHSVITLFKKERLLLVPCSWGESRRERNLIESPARVHWTASPSKLWMVLRVTKTHSQAYLKDIFLLRAPRHPCCITFCLPRALCPCPLLSGALLPAEPGSPPACSGVSRASAAHGLPSLGEGLRRSCACLHWAARAPRGGSRC